MNVAFLTLAFDEAAFNRWISAVGAFLCGIIAIGFLAVVLISLVTGSLTVGLKAALSKDEEQRKKGLAKLPGLVALMLVVSILIACGVFWSRSLVKDITPARRPLPARTVAGPKLPPDLGLPRDLFSKQRKGDWSVLRNGVRLVTFVVTDQVDGALSVAIASVDTGTRTITLEKDTRLTYPDLASRFGLSACPDVPQPESSALSPHTCWVDRKNFPGWEFYIESHTPIGLLEVVHVVFSDEVAFPGILSVELGRDRWVNLEASGHDDETLIGRKPSDAPWPK